MRRAIAAALVLLIGACHRDTSVPGELGRSQDEYGARYGAATTSPVTPDQIGYTAAPGTRLIARFADKRSVEELWIIDGDGQGLPEVLAQRARGLLGPDKTPLKTITFKGEGKSPADLFEEPAGTGVLRVDRRFGRLSRVALCAETAKCRMLDYLQKSEQDTDAMMAAAAKAMREQMGR
ncbi:MAG: hypothetical protein HYR72_00955 [Deltaproteobacteria bacterium]|nr:hypothetical protein [Deltaproteobacteria bacterium]MBI3391310.1 hypothetical protein [Deltaproteobacteria bacterium]